MKYSAVTLILTLLLPGVQTAEAMARPAVEILYPGEHVSTERCRLSVVGYSTVPKLQLYVNGEMWGELTVRDSVFHYSVRLPYGLNNIAVIPVVGNTASVTGDTAQVLCGPRFSREEGRLFESYQFHSDESPGECLRCHVQDVGDESQASNAEWCYPCHNMVRQRLRAHTIEDIRPCTGCHRIRRDLTVAAIMTPEEKNPCYQCHSDKIGLFTKDYVHGPVAGGSCTVCHDPHGSSFAKTLVRPVPVLCESCHTEISGTEKAVQHYPFAQGWCVDCHDPHSTSNKWALLKGGQELCKNCHFNDRTEATHTHPFDVKPKHKLASHLSLGESGLLECLSCHEPHAGNAPYLLRTNTANMCMGCHPNRGL
jgi:predicted CXXCH cytochrome family protein